MKKSINWNNLLLGLLVIVLIANVVAMGLFSVTINSKLDEAVEFTKPQEGVLTLVTSINCPKCRSMESAKDNLIAQNIELTEEKTFNADSEEGKKLIERFNIKKLPALVFESDDKIKTSIKKAFKEDGQKAEEKTLIWEQVYPPYFDLETETTVGLVNVTFLTDESCADCYDVVQTQKPILASFGLIPAEEKVVDISSKEGKSLINTYGITGVPTIILSEEAKVYTQLNSVWSQVGTVEEDGSYIFREMGALKVKYKNLETGKII